ncbi:sugar phosphate isomerase/epimerase family protein [Paludicola sp. MB14-C6]|uniref:sugar phosphate isomerase/epimerase family protein n=1 Tax=Paludihabitans sp. MB14-C6 TaxID=3070656 RepID=UPI0027DB3037|nr:sugar phosphate isomerase/epimerase family protein [Paludicola sp. MB14-C6]WMJ22970.1 sugar phosphate isomerase/epimerase family protein [Paludicola sp. MB14-C6]
MKVAVSTYSFARMMQNNQITQFGCIAKAKELGFEGIEFVDILPHDGSTVEEYARKLKEECQRLDMTITNYTFGADFLMGSDGDTKKEIERVKKQIDIAEILGATSVRHDATRGYSYGTGFKSFDSVVFQIADACREVTVYAKAKGIKTMVENHGFFSQDSERVEKLINAVNNENFGWLCDMGNFMCADENPAKAIGRAAPYAFYVHAKDFHQKNGMQPNPGEGFFRSRGGNYLRGAIIGHGDVPIQQCLSILKSTGYDGFVAIEFEGLEDNILGLSIGIKNLKRFIENA